MATAKNKAMIPLLAGVGVLAFLMMSGKKASAKGAAGTGAGGIEPGKAGDGTGTGGIGEPAGPSGCKPGLIISKDGICTVDPKSGTGTGTGGNGTGMKSSEIYISNACLFKFGDNTGESWWKNSGKSKATDWLKAGYENLLLIAYEMIRKNKESCFKDFPLQEDYASNVELQQARFQWIQNSIAIQKAAEEKAAKEKKPYPGASMWALLNAIRNFIDRDLQDGITYVKMDPKTYKLSFGKKFDFEKYWEYITPMAYYIFNNEIANRGSMLKKVGLSYPGYNNQENIQNAYDNTVLTLYTVIFPYILDKAALNNAITAKKIDNTTFYASMWDKVSDLGNANPALEQD